MANRGKKTAQEIEADKERYGEVVAFRLRRDHPDENAALEILKQMSKEHKKQYIVRAVLAQAEQPTIDDNARTAIELRGMVHDLTAALDTATRLIEQLSTLPRTPQGSTGQSSNSTLNQDFVNNMKEQKRPGKTLRRARDEAEE